MWELHWKLSRDPFAESDAQFVSTPTHSETVARLVHAIATSQRSAVLRAPAGLGKTMVLTQVIAEARRLARRVAVAGSPVSGSSLWADLAEGLGLRVPLDASRSRAWRRLSDAVRLCSLQGQPVVLAIDDCHYLTEIDDQLDLSRLVHVCVGAKLTVIQVGREVDADDTTPLGWELAVRLPPLTRNEAEFYVLTKLAAAGRRAPTFTTHALTRVHALSRGVPRGIDRIASLCLIVGASKGLDVISPDVVEGAALECVYASSDLASALPPA
jgi:MSHA biogenesis protein MshM